ncbi:MAG: outer membrane protein assembly factor, partial [Acetobacteraceae bacterium]|nr:outer membrane protein assembly factor [Acetobacteraceae bacterium]
DLGAAVTQLGGTASRGAGYNVTATLTKPDVIVRDQDLIFNLQSIKENLEAYDRTAVLGGVTLRRKLSDAWTVSVGLQAQQSRITQEGVTRDYTLLQLPLTAKYDSTGKEGLLEPTHGIRASATVTPTASLAGAGSDFVILFTTGSTYLNLGEPGRSVVALRATLGSIQGATTFQVPPDQRLYAGGSGTVRGYKYQSVGPKFPSGHPTGGTSLAAYTVEFRQRILDSFGAAVFVDAGQVDTGSSPFGGQLRAGAGMGARYYTPIGPIRLDVAVPLNRQRGDDALEVYIGIGQAF